GLARRARSNRSAADQAFRLSERKASRRLHRGACAHGEGSWICRGGVDGAGCGATWRSGVSVAPLHAVGSHFGAIRNAVGAEPDAAQLRNRMNSLNGTVVGLVGPLPPPSGGMANQTRQLARLLGECGLTVELVQVNAPYRPEWVGHLRGIR